MARTRSDAQTARPRARRRAARAARVPWSWIAVGGALLIAVLAYLGFTGAPGSGTRDAGAQRPADPRITLVTGQAAPDFALRSATTGQQVRLSDYRGKNVLLFFQEGVMCPPCWQQMRDLRAEQAKLEALDVVLLTLAVDPPEMLARNAERERVGDMLVLYDEGVQVSRAYQALYVSMHPGERPGHTFVLVGREGAIRWRQDFREMWVPSASILGPVARALGR